MVCGGDCILLVYGKWEDRAWAWFDVSDYCCPADGHFWSDAVKPEDFYKLGWNDASNVPKIGKFLVLMICPRTEKIDVHVADYHHNCKIIGNHFAFDHASTICGWMPIVGFEFSY